MKKKFGKCWFCSFIVSYIEGEPFPFVLSCKKLFPVCERCTKIEKPLSGNQWRAY